MILVRVDGIDTDGVGLELLQQRDISTTAGRVRQGIGVFVATVRCAVA